MLWGTAGLEMSVSWERKVQSCVVGFGGMASLESSGTPGHHLVHLGRWM